MDLLELWMSFVGLSMAISGLPQIIRLLKRKTSDDISILLWVLIIHGCSWWLVYGIINNSLSLVITNIFCLLIDTIIIILVFKYKNKREVTDEYQ